MIKRLVLVASVCLTALVISPCSDNSTQSGVELGLAGTDVAPTAADNLDVEGSPYNRSASCDSVFAGTKYVDHKLHKVLAKCDSVNKYYVYHGKPHSTATLIQLLNNWCTSQHGSTTTIIDADEQQCSSGSGAYNVATVGYVNKYGDLLAVYNASGGGQTKSAWGKNHYCNSGKNEGRTYAGLSSSSCSSSTTTTTTSTTTSGDAFEGYVNKYGDLLAVYNANSGGQTKSAWGKNHYCNNGRTEGRTYSGLSAASCSSTTTTTTTTTTSSSAESCYGDYVPKYPDLLAAYKASGGGQSIEAWGKSHYTNSGQSEGRSACSNSTTSTTTTSSWPSGNYQYLYDRNAQKLGGRTVRWKSKTIQISGAQGSWRGAVDRWTSATAVNLVHVGSTPSVENGIEIVGYDSNRVGNNCGMASLLYWESGTKLGRMYTCKIRIHPDHASKNCGSTASTITHEVGHCLGFRDHSADNGIMDVRGSCRDSGNCSITSNTRGFINLLYALSPGSDIRSKVAKLYRSMKQREGRLIKKNGGTLRAVDVYIKEGGDVEIVQKY